MNLPHIRIGKNEPFYWKLTLVDPNGRETVIPARRITLDVSAETGITGKLTLELDGRFLRLEDDLRLALENCKLIVKEESV